MTEQEWLASADPAAMLRLLISSTEQRHMRVRTPSYRKLRLFACACCRSVWHLLMDSAPCQNCSGGPGKEAYTGRAQGLPCPECHGAGRVNLSRRAVEVAERFADGVATKEELRTAKAGANDAFAFLQDMDDTIHARCADEAEETCAADAIYAASYPSLQVQSVLLVTQAALLRDIVGSPWRPSSLSPVGPGWSAQGEQWNIPYRIAKSIYDDRTYEIMPVLADALEEGGCHDAVILAHCRGPGPHVRGCWVLDLLLGKE